MDEVHEDENVPSEVSVQDALSDGSAQTVNVFQDDNEVPADDEQTNARLDEVAREVLKGEWGIGQERRLKLAEAGLDPTEVQRQIVRIVNQTP